MKSFLSVRVSLCLICAVTSCVMPSRAVNITETSTPLVKHSAATPLEVSAERLRVDIPLGSTIETGSFNSTDDPTPSPFSQVFHGGFDAFVAKLNTTDSTRVYATYVRGDDRDFGDTLSVDASGKASVVGVTNSPDFPTANQLQPIKAGGSLGDDAFLAQMSDGEFNPTSDTELDGGIHTFSSVYIPAGVTVTVIGDVVINVNGDTAIAGNLIGDCVQIELLGQGDLTITGTVDNRCTGDPTDAGDLILQSEGRNMTIGTEEAAASLHSSGDLDVTNDISIQDWEFDVLPDQRSDSPLPPVCSATSDTVLGTIVPGFPIQVQFFGEGADPDGGPVSYFWDFGDSKTSTERDAEHSYGLPGVYNVKLAVTDDDGETSTATIRIVMDDGDQNIPVEPGLWMEPTSLVVEAGQELSFGAADEDPRAEDVSFNWDFGDGETARETSPIHIFNDPGRFDIELTVADTEGGTTSATASVYVFPASSSSTHVAPSATEGLQARRLFLNLVDVRGKAGQDRVGNGRPGRRMRYRGRGNVTLGGLTNMQAEAGGNGRPNTGLGHVRGMKGGRGGSLQILVFGQLMINGGARLASGDGGNGGEAITTGASGLSAWAAGGNGGPAARRLRISATQGVTFLPRVTLEPGSGGNGGEARVRVGAGANTCPIANKGARAIATGGNGGNASKTFIPGNAQGLRHVMVEGGNGGHGGNARATGGRGGNATCFELATAGDGNKASARGGRGGDARLTGPFALVGIGADAFSAGDGGRAHAIGGDGGSATATPSGLCKTTMATGGEAGEAIATGGKGGRGFVDGDGGGANATGGDGGSADATGGDCQNCGDGGAAGATGGQGGLARARFGRGFGLELANARGGDGGGATATGGKGGDCDKCPAGKGGDGGSANAQGGDGGDAPERNGDRVGGAAGAADATGGPGGIGATCCNPPQQGGDGGRGGDATSTAGNPGNPGGTVGRNATKGGDGGPGGDGIPPGFGGVGGSGIGSPIDIPDGNPGGNGSICLVPSCDVTPRTIDFGMVSIGGSLDKALTVRNTGTGAFTITNINSTNAAYSIVMPALPVAVPAGGSVMITVRLTCPPFTSGLKRGVLSFVTGSAIGAVDCGMVNLTGSCNLGPTGCGSFPGKSGRPETTLPPSGRFDKSFDIEPADSDGDGTQDLIFVSVYGVGTLEGGAPDRLYERSGDTFVDISDIALGRRRPREHSADGKFGDLDGDDVPDLVVATDFGEPNRIYMGQRKAQGEWVGVDETQSRLRGPNDFSSLGVKLFDADNDGDLDIIFAVAGGVNQLYFNDGTGVFTNVTSLNVIGAPADDTEAIGAVGDVDNDGDLDIIVANANSPDGEQNRIWINQGGLQGGSRGRFRDRTRTQLPRFIDVTVDVKLADVDGDGDLDIYFSNSRPGGQQNRLLLNDGSGSFRDVTQLVQRQDRTNDAEFCDIDNDGDLDLFLANGLFTLATGARGETNRLFLNDGQGMFLQEVTATNYLGDSLASLDAEFVDMNGDGCCDLLVANYDEVDWIVLNASADGPTGSNAPPNTSGVKVISAKGFRSLVLDQNGTVWVWRRNDNRQHGGGGIRDRSIKGKGWQPMTWHIE